MWAQVSFASKHQVRGSSRIIKSRGKLTSIRKDEAALTVPMPLEPIDPRRRSPREELHRGFSELSRRDCTGPGRRGRVSGNLSPLSVTRRKSRGKASWNRIQNKRLLSHGAKNVSNLGPVRCNTADGRLSDRGASQSRFALPSKFPALQLNIE